MVFSFLAKSKIMKGKTKVTIIMITIISLILGYILAMVIYNVAWKTIPEQTIDPLILSMFSKNVVIKAQEIVYDYLSEGKVLLYTVPIISGIEGFLLSLLSYNRNNRIGLTKALSIIGIVFAIIIIPLIFFYIATLFSAWQAIQDCTTSSLLSSFGYYNASFMCTASVSAGSSTVSFTIIIGVVLGSIGLLYWIHKLK